MTAMLKSLKKLLSTIKRKSPAPFILSPNNGAIPVSDKLEPNKQQIRHLLGSAQDITMRDFQIDTENKRQLNALLVAVEGLVDESAIRQNVLRALMEKPLDDKANVLTQVEQRLYVKKFMLEADLNKAILEMLHGAALLFIEGLAQAIVIPAEAYELRTISEPPTEAVVKGPREGFVEATSTNLALLRRRIPHPALRFETIVIGQYTRSEITIAYVEGIADPQVVENVKTRLREIRTDSLLSSGELEQYIEEAPYSIFPTVGNTERPDKAASMMMEGRVVILVSGDPVALTVPHLFIECLQNQEDYSSRPYLASFIRLLRVSAFVASVTLPSVYLFAMNFHKESIPSELIVSMTEARQRVPFPIEMELLGLMVAFEIVREAGVRMPRAIGQTVSIVGALILGQVSVQAGFIGAPTIIVVAMSAIASFIITPIAEVAALLRFLMVIPTALFGFFGFIGVGLMILTHMASLNSFGAAYLAPISPFYFREWKDTFVRFPYRSLRKRPRSIPHVRSVRIEQMPDGRKGQRDD